MKFNLQRDIENCKYLALEFVFPTLGKVNSFNEWADVYYSGFKIDFPTKFYYVSDFKSYWHLDLTLLGFGFKLTRQYGY